MTGGGKAMSHLKDRLARVWAEDLQARLPEGHKVYPQRRPVKRLSGRPAEEVEPPFTVLRVKAIEQTAPGFLAVTGVMQDDDLPDACQQGFGSRALLSLRHRVLRALVGWSLLTLRAVP